MPTIPQKVLMVLPTPFPSNRGSPGGVLEMCRVLSARGVECHVVCYAGGEQRSHLPAQVHAIPSWGLYRQGLGPSWSRLPLDALLLLQALRTARRVRPQVIHAHLHEGAWAAYPAAKWLGVPLLFDIHTHLAEELDEQGFARRGSLVGKLAAWVDRVTPRLADGCVSVNANTIARQRRLTPGVLARQLPNGTDFSLFHPDRPSGLRARLGLEGHFVIGYQGNTSAQQRLDLLIALAPALLARQPRARILIGHSVGEVTPLQGRIAALGLQDKVLLYPTPLAAAAELINACDVMVVPRLGFSTVPMKVRNALACGTPVVLHEAVVGGMEADTDPRQSGVRTFRDEASLLEAMLAWADDPSGHAQAREAAHTFALAHYSDEVVADRLLAMYGEILKATEP